MGSPAQLRQAAKRLYARFPDAATELGIQPLLDKPITTAKGHARSRRCCAAAGLLVTCEIVSRRAGGA